MKPPLPSALSLLAGEAADAGLPREVARSEVDREGRASLQLASEGAPRWFTVADGALTELHVEHDRRVPLCAHLPELRAGGAEVLAWRPGRRVVVKTGGAILKGYRRGRAVPAMERAGTAELALVGSGVRAPGVRALDIERCAVELELLAARPLVLAADATDELFRLGHGLRVFQEAAPTEGLGLHDRRSELAAVDGMAAKATRLLGHAPDGVEELRVRLGEHVDEPEPLEPVLCHRDLHDRQVLRCDGGLALIDFDLLCRGDAALDVANLSAHLALRALQGVDEADEELVEDLSSALLEGLDRGDEPGFDARLRFYQSATFLRLALLYATRPRWSGLVPDLLSFSKRCLHEIAAR